jgi:hypothetical protein
MNTQSGFLHNRFLIFILVACISFAALPVLSQNVNEYSDSYIIAKMHTIQSEMALNSLGSRASKPLECFNGEVGYLIGDINRESLDDFSCRVNKATSQMVVFAKLSTDEMYCVDSNGGRLYVDRDPETGYHCH